MGNIIRLRDKQSGEFRDVDDSTPEFAELKQQVLGSGAPRWEQTGDHHVQAAVARAREGQATEEDLGDERPPRPLNGPPAPTQAEVDPWRELTPAEVEAGLTPDKKEEQLREQFGYDEDDDDADLVPAAALAQDLKKGSETIASSASDTTAVADAPRRRRGQGGRSSGSASGSGSSGSGSGGSESS